MRLGKKETIVKEITHFKIANPKVDQLHILVHGPIGTGKSSFISSIASIFKGHMVQAAMVDAAGAGHSFTKEFKITKLRNKDGKFLPFVISDIMGLEDSEAHGAHTEDLVTALEGHLEDGYLFNPVGSLKEGNQFYKKTPTMSDKVHCLVSVLPGDKIGMMQTEEVESVIKKLRQIRERASKLRIPQVVVMTMVDNVCPEVQRDLKMIYRSKKIKEKMQECTNRLGVPMTSVFPVKNYHEEIALHNDVDILLLSALKNILLIANDHVQEKVAQEKVAQEKVVD
ncbi:interferon-induced protein 44-like [Engraulis encrasicolus]|uniref:interferon-induced protein 44-like n=1 Tax=Engraulis encrasicolus TaxID=184585 RepID=UPI002FD75162